MAVLEEDVKVLAGADIYNEVILTIFAGPAATCLRIRADKRELITSFPNIVANQDNIKLTGAGVIVKGWLMQRPARHRDWVRTRLAPTSESLYSRLLRDNSLRSCRLDSSSDSPKKSLAIRKRLTSPCLSPVDKDVRCGG